MLMCVYHCCNFCVYLQNVTEDPLLSAANILDSTVLWPSLFSLNIVLHILWPRLSLKLTQASFKHPSQGYLSAVSAVMLTDEFLHWEQYDWKMQGLGWAPGKHWNTILSERDGLHCWWSGFVLRRLHVRRGGDWSGLITETKIHRRRLWVGDNELLLSVLEFHSRCGIKGLDIKPFHSFTA